MDITIGVGDYDDGFYLTDEECKCGLLTGLLASPLCFYLTDEECKLWRCRS